MPFPLNVSFFPSSPQALSLLSVPSSLSRMSDTHHFTLIPCYTFTSALTLDCDTVSNVSRSTVGNCSWISHTFLPVRDKEERNFLSSHPKSTDIAPPYSCMFSVAELRHDSRGELLLMGPSEMGIGYSTPFAFSSLFLPTMIFFV